jgi:glycosyltransferase involved in cell wall biosynthesis
MKLLVICHDHPHLTDGGTEHAAHDLCRTLADMPGIEARFLAVSTSLSHPQQAPGTLHRMDGDDLLRTGRYDMFSMRRRDGTDWTASVAEVLDRTEPDVVHLHGLDRIGADIIPLLRRLRPSVRIVLTLHDFQLICANQGLLLRRDGSLCERPSPDACQGCFPEIAAASHALRKARLLGLLHEVDAFIAPSRDLRDRFIAWGLPVDRLSIIPNAVPERTLVLTAPRARPDRFAYFGSLAEHKGVGVLLQAAARLARQQAELRLSLYGRLHHPAPEARDAFREGLSQAGPIAQYVGPYNRDEVHDLMAQTDWVLLPSLWFENAPLVLLEAQRAGRPVICTALGGMQELVRDGVDGVFVPRGDPAALAETMQALAGNPEIHARLAGNLRPPPTLADSADRHLRLYQSLLESLAA